MLFAVVGGRACTVSYVVEVIKWLLRAMEEKGAEVDEDCNVRWKKEDLVNWGAKTIAATRL